MEETIKLGDLISPVEEIELLEKKGMEKIPNSDQPNAESFIVDVARLSRISNKQINANSKLNRSFSRKGSPHKSSEKKTNPINGNEKDSKIVASASPRATLGGASMLEKVLVGPSDRAPTHHQITIKTTVNGGGAESRSPVKRASFRRSQPSWTFDPRKVFFFLATLSSMGTILLIYFTLSISKASGDDSAQNW